MSADDTGALPDNVIPFPGPSVAPASPTSSAQETTTLVASQIRGWSDVAAVLGADGAADALRAAVDAVVAVFGERGGSGISVEGESGTPDISATFTGPGGARNAISAAAAARLVVTHAQAPAPSEHQFRIGTGMDTAAVGIGRTSQGVTYKEVGVLRSSATRLRDFAGAGQIFLTDTTLAFIGDAVTVQPLGPVRIEAAGDSREAFSLTTLN